MQNEWLLIITALLIIRYKHQQQQQNGLLTLITSIQSLLTNHEEYLELS